MAWLRSGLTWSITAFLLAAVASLTLAYAPTVGSTGGGTSVTVATGQEPIRRSFSGPTSYHSLAETAGGPRLLALLTTPVVIAGVPLVLYWVRPVRSVLHVVAALLQIAVVLLGS